MCLQVLPAGDSGESFEVQARGELQLGLLMGGFTREPRCTTACLATNVNTARYLDAAPKEGTLERPCACCAENMRREGFEFAVSPPKVVYRCACLSTEASLCDINYHTGIEITS